MAEVIRLDDHRAHFTVITADGNAHILPEVNVEEYINGKRALGQIAGEDSDKIVQAMLADYIRIVKDTADA